MYVKHSARELAGQKFSRLLFYSNRGFIFVAYTFFFLNFRTSAYHLCLVETSSMGMSLY